MNDIETTLRQALVEAERAAPAPRDLADRLVSGVSDRLDEPDAVSFDFASFDKAAVMSWLSRPAVRRWLPPLVAAVAVIAVIVGLALVRHARPESTPPVKVKPSPAAQPYKLRSLLAIGPGQGHVVVDYPQDRAFMSGAGGIIVIDMSALRVEETILGRHPFGALAFDPDSGLLYAANGSSAAISVIDPVRGRVMDTIAVHPARILVQLALDTRAHLLLASDERRTVVVVDLHQRKVVDYVHLGRHPFGVALDPRHGVFYVAGARTSVIDTSTRKVLTTIKGLSGTTGFALDEARGHMLAWNEGLGTVSVIDTSTRAVIRTITVGGRGPFDVEVDEDRGTALVGGGRTSLTVIDLATLAVTGTVKFQSIGTPRYPVIFDDLAVEPFGGDILGIGCCDGMVRVISQP